MSAENEPTIDQSSSHVMKDPDNELTIDGIPVRIINKRKFARGDSATYKVPLTDEITNLSQVYRDNPDLTDKDRFDVAMGLPPAILRKTVETTNIDIPDENNLMVKLSADELARRGPDVPDKQVKPVLDYVCKKLEVALRKTVFDESGKTKLDEYDRLSKNISDQDIFEDWIDHNVPTFRETVRTILYDILRSNDFATFRQGLDGDTIVKPEEPPVATTVDTDDEESATLVDIPIHTEATTATAVEDSPAPKEASVFDATLEDLPDELRATIYPEHSQPILNYLSIRYQDLIRKTLLDALGQEKLDEFDALSKTEADEEQLESWEQKNIPEVISNSMADLWPGLLESKDFAKFRDFLTANIPVDKTFPLPTIEKSVDTEPRIPTDEQLLKGLVLGKEETVAFELFDSTNFNKSPDRSKGFKRYSILLGKERQVKIEGVHALAEVRVGAIRDLEKSVSITIYEAPGEGLLVGISDSDASVRLKPGQGIEIGRKTQQLEDLNRTVSGTHCTISLDTEGRLVVTNHNPTNNTAVRRFTH